MLLYTVATVLVGTSISWDDLVEYFDSDEMVDMIPLYKIRSRINSVIFFFLFVPFMYVLNLIKLNGVIALNYLSKKNMNSMTKSLANTLYTCILIQVLSMTVPNILIHVTNNLLIEEDMHSTQARGVFNFGTLNGLALVLMLGLVSYLRLGNNCLGEANITNDQIECT